jgi:competence protein CoiA
MSLYAVDQDDLVHAADAEAGKVYGCLECFSPVKRRQGKQRFPHFYHLKASPRCKLYSKAENHLLAQTQIQKMFPENEVVLEKPFLAINRIADLCWEKEKIIFEIQCSPISQKEAEMRNLDYRSIGYETVWLLDDKRYNQRFINPAEEYLRKSGAYYLSIRQNLCYDQFEVALNGRRIRKSKKLPVRLTNIFRFANKSFPESEFPKQITELKSTQYFRGDRMDRALHNQSAAMLYWRALEREVIEIKQTPLDWIRRLFIQSYLNRLMAFLKRR